MNPSLHAVLGPLASIVTDETRDVCLLPDGTVWQRRAAGFEQTDLRLDAREARRIGTLLVESSGGRVDDAHPAGDSALAGEVRAHVVLPPLSRHGATVSLRFPRQTPVTESDFEVDDAWEWSSFTSESVLIVGATGSGKTTVTELLIARLPTTERVIVLEDIPELVARHPHRVSLTTRVANAEGAGRVSLGHLVRESLRMSPDRIVVGEVRGAEIVDLLLALTAGHRGLSTIHARSLAELPERLIALGMIAGVAPEVIARLVPVAFARVVLCERTESGHRLSVGTFRRRGDTLVVDW